MKTLVTGKILQDANTVESYHIEEKGFIVCMVSKVSSFMIGVDRKVTDVRQPKAAPAGASNTPSSSKAPVTPAPATAHTPVPPAAPAPASNTSAQDVPGTSSPTPAAPTGTTAESGTFNDPSALTLGSQRDAAVANMESMGFPRADIDRAMRAAFFNPDRAVEYLLNVCVNSISNQNTTDVYFRAYQRTFSRSNSKQLIPQLLLVPPLHAKQHPLHPPQQLRELHQAILATSPLISSKPPHRQAVVAPAGVLNDKAPRPPPGSSAKALEGEQALVLVPEAKLPQAGSVILISFEPIHNFSNYVR